MSLLEFLREQMGVCAEDLIAELEYSQENSCGLYLANRSTKDSQRHQIDFLFWSTLLQRVKEEINEEQPV